MLFSRLRLEKMALQASAAAYIKIRLAGTVNKLNVEHRTSNIERRILMALRFIDFETSESQNFKGGFALHSFFLN